MPSPALEWVPPLLGSGARRLDELRHPGIAPLYIRPVHRLELGLGEGMGRGAVHDGLGPRLQPRIVFKLTDRLDAVEEQIALQEGRIGGIDQRVSGAVEKGAAALLYQRFL